MLTAVLTAAADSGLGFNDMVNRIAGNNADLKATRLELEAQRSEQKSTLNLSDPEIEFSHKWGPANAGNKTEFGISQGFDWPGVYVHRKQSVKHKENALLQLWQSNIIDRKFEIKLTLLDMVYLNRCINLLNRRLAAIDSLMSKYADPVNRTSLTRLDLNKLKIERYRLNSKLKTTQSQKSATMQQLAAMNGNAECADAATVTEFPEEQILPAAEYEKLIANSPEMLASEAETESLNSQIKAVKSMSLPGFSVGYSYAREEHKSFNGFSFGVSLPLFANRHKVKSVTLLKEAQLMKQRQLQFDATTQTYALLLKVQSLKRLASEARELICDTDYSRLLRMALDGGQISLSEYLIESNYYLEFEEEYLDACYQYQCEAARLNKYTNDSLLNDM